MICPTDPPQKDQKNPEKKKSKQRPSKGTYPGWIQRKISRSVFRNMQITSEPFCSDACARLKIQIPMHSISLGCPKIVRHCDPISLLINTFGIHLELGCKSHEQIIHYRTAKNVPKTSDSFALFLDEFLSIHPEGISCSLTNAVWRYTHYCLCCHQLQSSLTNNTGSLTVMLCRGTHILYLQ